MYVPTWGGLAPATMRFNEALTNGFLIQPSNAWTNAAYVLTAVLMLAFFRRDKNRKLLYSFSAVSLLVGVSSFFYHASNAFFFQVFDLSSMYLLSALLLTLNFSRMTGLTAPAGNAAVFGLSFVIQLSLLLRLRGRSGAVIFGAAVLSVLVLELLVRYYRKTKIAYRELWTAILVFAAAFFFWLLDYNRLLFSPENHFLQGHGLWHIINSFCFVFLYRFYRQFPVRGPINSGDSPNRKKTVRRS